mmetsp:Transcript_23450/g.54649  ORF Transcript_23450/g.54649 Transcript_23450/m.54649 type:complete len:764 (+) Transcript_23450:110-2401(+)|eukprot:CAMPEP_0178401602 /NCGR_PEP_ID=MMETSP0689_2-20121128/16388_1 /TAXON_ID=160604 /ORGANISM="Amphidinium massartii, Strain CS-259" /LENGTH=763 /DNA_ID=CAMNT_0020022431 /DNA_START=127 /DNA_END=2418 /DNA_ORIENTATION=+
MAPSTAAGPTAIFDHIATFLERCHLTASADVVKADVLNLQTPEKQAALLEDVSKHLRPLVDAAVVVMAEMDAGAFGTLAVTNAIQTEAQALEQTIDTLMRKLMASRYCLSDDKLKMMVGGVLVDVGESGVPGVEAAAAEKEAALSLSSAVMGVNDADVQRYWAQIQEESTGGGAEAEKQQQSAPAEPAAAPANADALQPEQLAATSTTGETAVPLGGGLPPPSTGPSSHYVTRQPRGTPEAEEEWEKDDEYHDDDDPGYRIREIYESELLAELSAKNTTTLQTSAAPAAQPGGEAAPAGEGSDDSKAAAPTTPAGATAAKAEGGPEAESATAPAEATATTTPAATATPALDGEKSVEVDKDFRPEQKQLELRQRMRRNVKYAASADPFYPVELDGAIYDSFNLRVVFERDKTGFEESKEFPIRMNTVIGARYQILEYLGSAAFSRAVQCLDLETNKLVCMKIIKNDKDFFDQSLDEIKLLKYINVNGDVDDHCVLRLYDYFYHKEHLIIVTELLRDNLYEFSKYNRECGDEPYFTLGHLQKIAKQVLTALDYVHSLRLMHCDLKPENILIKSYSRCEVKVIDFGSSCFIDDHLSSYVQSRSYRAPEVMLGLPYDQKIDLWSLGCILAELWTGYVLFQNDSVQSLLVRIIGIIGEFPYHLMTRGRYVPQYFTQDGQLYQEIDGPVCPERGRRLHLLVPKKTSLRQRMRTDSEEFLDFLTQLLKLDPAERPTATEALQHPWITQCKYPDGIGTGPPPPLPQPPAA